MAEANPQVGAAACVRRLLAQPRRPRCDHAADAVMVDTTSLPADRGRTSREDRRVRQ